MIKYYIWGMRAFGILLTGTYVLYTEREKGVAAERAKLEKANEEFRKNSNRGAWDFDACDRAGGLFDFKRRTCKLPGT